ncbi:MAG TPA: hypothetical protein VNH11_32750 [Pirellulales bacterium]|nr:hypothetical protein [Pirellulales bacterium]
MPEVRVAVRLPYLLLLPDGEYATPAVGGSIRLREQSELHQANEPEELRTEVSALFVCGSEQEDAVKQIRAVQAERLLRQTNHLLRWYRAVSRQPRVAELSRAQASRFCFTVEETGELWSEPLEYGATPEPLPAEIAEIQQSIREGLASAAEPSVASLSMLDAEYAIKTGRFREAILFCWSAIDATFSRKYEALVDDALAENGTMRAGFFAVTPIFQCATA